MPENRFYFDKKFSKGDIISLEGNEFHHLVHVMRAAVGEEIEVVNGLGQLAHGQIADIKKKLANIKIENVENRQPPKFDLILAQAIPRLNRLDFIIEKGTELGMTKLLLFPSLHSERKKFTDDQHKRMLQVAISAMKQCGRLDLPVIECIAGLKEIKEFEKYNIYFGDVSADASLLISEWKRCPPKNGAIFFIGPESGFSDEEVTLLKNLGAKGIKLHGNILRTDTASLATLALASQLHECNF